MSSTHTLVARRYAEALFELAEGPALDGVARDVESLRAMLADSADLRRAVSSPVVPRASRIKAMEAIANGAQLGELTRKFLGVVAGNNRLADISAIVEAFLSEVADRRGLRQVEITSARPLSEAQRARLETALNQALAAKTVVTAKVDPSLIGGLVVRVGSSLVDASLKTKLDRLGRVLKQQPE